MKWKERLLLLLFTLILLLLVLLKKRSIDDSLLLSVRSTNDNSSFPFLDDVIDDVTVTSRWSQLHPWDVWQDMVGERALTHRSEVQVTRILKEMMIGKILHADVGYKGTQLKARFTLAGPEPQVVVFKPKRYQRDRILDGSPYEGYDRHNAEIAAFHLDRVIGFYRVPPAVGRIVNLDAEVKPVARKKLSNTFFTKGEGDGSDVCFYGVCMYCKKSEPACGDGPMMEGALILWVPHKWGIAKTRNPWQRTYTSRKARWELDDDYCLSVVAKRPYNLGPRLLDLMDAAVFDFLIGNADRHHYEYLSHDKDNGMMLLLDNGKSFGNPYKDETSILAPLYQCCKLRQSTYNKLKTFSTESTDANSLSRRLVERTEKDPLHPLLTDDHLVAIDRRLKRILTTVDMCFDREGRENVLMT